jgi:hypothetical protein
MKPRQHLELLARASLAEHICPEPDVLAAYMLRVLSGNDELRVAAHVRSCPLCSDELEAARPPAARPPTVLARPVPVFVPGLRGSSVPAIRRYTAPSLGLTVEIALTQSSTGTWRLSGQLAHDTAGVADRAIVLRSRRRTYHATSEQHGFFTFDDLPAGRYTLTIAANRAAVQVRGLLLEA